MPYRNIDSMLEDSDNPVFLTNEPMSNMSELPENGEKVHVKTLYGEILAVTVHRVKDDGETCQGVTDHESWEGSPGEMEQHFERGDLVEFSSAKICIINRD